MCGQTDGRTDKVIIIGFRIFDERVIIIQIQHDGKELCPGHGFCLCTQFDLNHCRYDLGHGHDIPSVH